MNIFSEVKSIYGDNIKVVVAEAPATTKVALLILLNIKATSVLKDLATDYKSS